MKIPFTLRPRSERAPATALLLPSAGAEDLFDLVARLGLQEFPAIHATADGFLFKLPQPLTTPLAGVIHLRALSKDLFLPVDAELTPPLLLDEAEGLVRDRGLVFLPSSRVLEFAPAQPLSWNQLLKPPELHASSWQSLPEAPALAEELLEVTSTAPPPPPDAILEQGRDDIGTESPQPRGGQGLGKQLAAGAAYAAGKSLAWLGTKMGMASLASLGAGLLQRAFDLVPFLSQRLMGEQEATLRDLLKDFREGKIDAALRRALPLNGSSSRPATPAGDARLPLHNLFHSLQNLLGGRQGPVTNWFMPPGDLYGLLVQEYRRQAEAAAQRGDFRRAAFIHAKLLNDLGAAALILSQGGLHRDAAVIYEEALKNPRAAASEWEAAGEIDKAVELFVRIGDHLAAAEVLRKVGESERALVHYRRAAEQLAAQKKFFEAGEIFRVRAQRPDLALDVFRTGWATRPELGALPCGLFLADHYAQEPNLPRFLQMLGESEEFLPTMSRESGVQCFNQIARLSRHTPLAPIAAEVQDRCLLALAGKIAEQEASSRGLGRRVSQYFPADSPWPTPVTRDAQFAMQKLQHTRAGVGSPVAVARLGNSTVRAVCHMPLSDDLFLGFDDGEIIHLRMATGKHATLRKQPGPVVGLATDAEERLLVALVQTSADTSNLLVASRSVHFRFSGYVQSRAAGAVRLAAGVDNQPSPFVGVLSPDRCQFYRRDNPSWSKSYLIMPDEVPHAAMVGCLPHAPEQHWCLLFLDDTGIFLCEGSERFIFPVEAAPEHPPRSTLYQSPLQGWLEDPTTLTAHWVARNGDHYSVTFQLDGKTEQHPHPVKMPNAKPIHGVHGCNDRRLTVKDRTSLWDSVHEHWLTQGQLFNPVAAFSMDSGEILLVEANGALTRIPGQRR